MLGAFLSFAPTSNGHARLAAAPASSGSAPPEPAPSTPSPTHPITPSSPLSPSQELLLESLARGSDPASLAASHNLSLLALARWLQEPHVKEALDTLLDLRALHRKLWQEEVTKEAIETLRQVSKTADNPVESRRAASAILRALAASNRARSAPSPAPRGGGGRVFEAGGGSEGHRARSASEGPASSAPGAPPHRSTDSSPSDSPHAGPSAASITPSPPRPYPPPPDSFPDLLTRHAIDLLYLLDSDAPEAAAEALAPFIDAAVAADPAKLAALSATLAEIVPLAADTNIPYKVRHWANDDRRSWKRVEFTHPPGHTRTFAFYFERPAVTDDHPELDPYGDDGPPWRIVSITPPGTAPPAETG